MSGARLGVGLIGAGPVVQAIHVPTLQHLADRFRVTTVMDVDPAVAGAVASRLGARATTSVEDLLADDRVDVVAICSPAPFHARQLQAALAAGVRAVLCEKPLATSRDEAEAIAAAASAARVPVLVGAMHTVDPAWTAARTVWGDLPARTHTVRSRIVLPTNTRFEDWATELLGRPAPRSRDMTDPAVRADVFVDAVYGLAIHNLPLVREFLPRDTPVQVDHAQLLSPWGYLATVRAGDRVVQLTGQVNGRWEPQWTFEALADDAGLHVRFPPSFVHAGSAVATLSRGTSSTVLGPFPSNGYVVEWELLAEAAAGRPVDVPSPEDLVADLTFAVDVAEQAAEILRTEEVGA